MPEIKARFLDISRDFKPEESIFIHPHSYNRNFDTMHYHNFYELVAVRHGSGQHMTKDGTYSIYPGDVFLIRPGDPHGYCNMRQMELINLLYRPGVVTGTHGRSDKNSRILSFLRDRPAARR